MVFVVVVVVCFSFIFVVIHLLVGQGNKVYLPMPPCWPEVLFLKDSNAVIDSSRKNILEKKPNED